MKEVEDIIISKKYFELTPSELELVQELAANEEDYEAMKWFLTSTHANFSSAQINPSAGLRNNVMAHLNKQPAQKTIWLNGAVTFLFPKQKKLYQMPALQMAAVAVLLIGVVLVYNGNFKEQDNLALNTPEVEDVLTTNETKVNESQLLNEPSKEVIADEVDGERQNEPDVPFLKKEYLEKSSANEQLKDYDGANDKDLSVAEEVKFNWYRSDNEGPGTALGQNNSGTVATGSATTSSETVDEIFLSTTVQKDAEKDLKNKKSGNIKSESSKVADAYSVNQSPAMVDDNILVEEKKESEDSGTYKTAMAGGVYRETIAVDGRNEVTSKLDTEPPKPQYSIVQSKELKALFGTFK